MPIWNRFLMTDRNFTTRQRNAVRKNSVSAWTNCVKSPTALRCLRGNGFFTQSGSRQTLESVLYLFLNTPSACYGVII
jgi:hypothetical protein